MSAIEEMLAKLHHPDLKAIEPGLERVLRFLGRLGNPHTRLPPVIHIAGTNGKGSLLAYLRAIAEAEGMRVHAYTSPHLIRFNERIVIAGREIDDDTLMGYIQHILPLMQSAPATFFEATTAIAFLAFAEHAADIVLLETGMGGRWDATNVVDTPLLTAITPVALDHCEYLGATLEAVAAEKAGILKSGVPCVVGRQRKKALLVLRSAARRKQAALSIMGEDWQAVRQDNGGVYTEWGYQLTFLPALAGAHQIDNAATAIACMRQIPQWPFSDDAIRRGIAGARWPGRLQRLADYNGREVWLDGGHNPHGAAALAAWAEEGGRKLILICGMMQRKDAAGFFAPLAPRVQRLYAIAVPGEAEGYPPQELAEAARALGIPAQPMPSLDAALAEAARHGDAGSRVLICGSLYLAGKVLSLSSPEEAIA